MVKGKIPNRIDEQGRLHLTVENYQQRKGYRAVSAYCEQCRRWHFHGEPDSEYLTGETYRISHCSQRAGESFNEDYILDYDFTRPPITPCAPLGC